MTQFLNFIFSWQMLAGIILGISFTLLLGIVKEKIKLNSLSSFFLNLFKSRSGDKTKNRRDTYESVKSNLNEMLDTLFSPEKVKKSVSVKVKKSVKNSFFSSGGGQSIKNEILEAHTKYMAFGETLSRTTYSNKQLINDYHNFIYRIIEKLDSASSD